MKLKHEIEGFNFGDAVDEIEKIGAVSLGFLSNETRLALLDEVKGFAQRFPGLTKKGFETAPILQSPFVNEFLAVVQDTLNRQLGGELNVFPSKLDLMPFFIAYRVGHSGLTPHVDVHDRNLVCNFILAGNAPFRVYPKGLENEIVELDTTPGRVIVMRTAGFRGVNEHVLHSVGRTESERYVLSLRQPEEATKKAFRGMLFLQ